MMNVIQKCVCRVFYLLWLWRNASNFCDPLLAVVSPRSPFPHILVLIFLFNDWGGCRLSWRVGCSEVPRSRWVCTQVHITVHCTTSPKHSANLVNVLVTRLSIYRH